MAESKHSSSWVQAIIHADKQKYYSSALYMTAVFLGNSITQQPLDEILLWHRLYQTRGKAENGNVLVPRPHSLLTLHYLHLLIVFPYFISTTSTLQSLSIIHILFVTSIHFRIIALPFSSPYFNHISQCLTSIVATFITENGVGFDALHCDHPTQFDCCQRLWL